MKTTLRQTIGILALAVSIGVTGVTLQAQEPDYSHNKNYQQGMREGHADHLHNKDHSKKHHFKKDDDQKAYEAGYQKGRT
jgi:hypothetical protein